MPPLNAASRFGLYERIFPRWRPDRRFRPEGSAGDDAVRVRWLGTASFVVETRTTTLLVDPYLTRRSLPGLLLPHEPDERALFAAPPLTALPSRVHAVLCGHSHYDHVADAPRIARRTGASLVGSDSTCAWGRAEGLADSQLTAIPQQGGSLRVGDFEVRFVASRHGKALLHRVPLPGFVDRVQSLPRPVWSYKMGGAFGILIKTPGLSLYHNGSADLIDAELADMRADVLLAGLAGRKHTDNYLGRLVGHLAPSLVIPTHHDAFFAPLARGVHLLPGIDLEGFLAEARLHAPQATRITLGYGETLSVPLGDARGAVLAPR